MEPISERNVAVDLARDVQAIRVRIFAIIAAGGCSQQEDPRTPGQGLAMEFHVLGQLARLNGGGRFVAENFLDTAWDQGRVGNQLSALIGEARQAGRRPPEKARHGFVAGSREQPDK